ncbi:MAG: hypothetical protein EXS13_07220 [Planctomycetes bacterium]|nr:hypothetical protein [Planctomycetota bacterium]
MEFEVELADGDRRGAARKRAFAAAAALGAKRIAIHDDAAEETGEARELVAAAKAARLEVVRIVDGGAARGRCPNDPAALREATARAAAVASRCVGGHGAAAIELVGFGFPAGGEEGVRAQRFLAALCECAGCVRRLAARQFDGAKLIAKAKKLIAASAAASAGGTALERPEEIGPWLVKQLGASESAALLATRKEALVGAVQEVRKVLPAGVVLRAVAHPSPFVGGRALGGGLLALSDWLDGFTLDAATPATTAPATIAAAVKSARSAALPTSRFTLRLALPPPSECAALIAQLKAAEKEGAVAVRCFDTATWSDAQLEAVGKEFAG